MQLGGDFLKLQEISKSNLREIAMKSPLVYTCHKSCIGECDKIRIKNRMCKGAFLNPGALWAPVQSQYKVLKGNQGTKVSAFETTGELISGYI